jgi:hypothetical protein
MARVEFQDFSVQVKDALDDAVLQFLEEAGSELEAQTKRNQTRVDSGETKGQWTHVVDESKQICTVGNPLENAIWEEFGTGEYALEGNGRKGGWWYQDKDTGKWHFTTGKTPLRPLHTAFERTKAKIIRRAEQVLKGRMN